MNGYQCADSTVVVDGDRSGAAVLDDEHPVGSVPIFAGELLVLRAAEPGHDRGEQAGQVLHAFDDVAVAVIHLGELVHDAGHRGAVPRVLGFVIDAGDEAGGMQSQFGADGGSTDARPEEKRRGFQGAGGGHDGRARG